MARADSLHALASGNKIYKLKPVFEYAKEKKISKILSFGGAYSNHIHALALLAQQNNIQAHAIIRGEEKYANNPTLTDVKNAGMTLEFVSREEYRLRTDATYLETVQRRYPDALIVPEGGSSQLAIKGCAQMATDINLAVNSDFLAIPSGTGATAAGLACGLENNQRLMIYSVLKDPSLESRIASFIHAENSDKPHKIKYKVHNADFGGYAKLDKGMLDFILEWLQQTGILLDPIYTSKMCRRLLQQLEAGEYTPGQSITLIHSGGLQGWRGMQKRVETLSGHEAWEQINHCLAFESDSD